MCKMLKKISTFCKNEIIFDFVLGMSYLSQSGTGRGSPLTIGVVAGLLWLQSVLGVVCYLGCGAAMGLLCAF